MLEGVGIFALLVIILGLVRLGIEKMSDTFHRALLLRTKFRAGPPMCEVSQASMIIPRYRGNLNSYRSKHGAVRT
jgi:hypothetical protein